MSVSMLLVKSYALNVYMNGTTTFEYIQSVRPDYVLPVKQRGADAFYIEDIDDALTKGWITQQEHDDTLALKGPEDPKYRPIIELMATEAPII